jgi:hypothetical protein
MMRRSIDDKGGNRMTPSVQERYERLLRRDYPILVEQAAMPDVHMLVFPGIIDIPAHTLASVQGLIRALFALRGSPSYRDRIRISDEEIGRYEPRNYSVLMGYDFHIEGDGTPRLIEVNTNAAFSLGADLVRESQSVENPFVPSFVDALRDAFIEEYARTQPGEALKGIAIVDDDYRAQNFYFEFLMFKQLFERWGWRCTIGSPEDFHYSEADETLRDRSGRKIDLVYNRLTDFLLADAAHRHLRAAYLAGRTCFTPNPYEYALLADKQRLVEWTRPGWLESVGLPVSEAEMIRRLVPPAHDLEEYADTERLWRERRRLFFKPKHAFGSKGVYKGASLTRKTFVEILNHPYIAQEFVPPAWVTGSMETTQTAGQYKYDVRFYVYKGEIQLMIGRVYRGQVTNLRTAGGGFAAMRSRS